MDLSAGNMDGHFDTHIEGEGLDAWLLLQPSMQFHEKDPLTSMSEGEAGLKSSVSSSDSSYWMESLDAEPSSTDLMKEFVKHPEEEEEGPKRKTTLHQKQAHNKIEKRYRINSKIAKLQRIIPWLANEQTAFETWGNSINSSKGGAPKLNKSIILEKAVDYILYLQNNQRLYEMEVRKFKQKIEQLKS